VRLQLVNRRLIALLEDGRYALTAMGHDFMDRINGFWYAPKAV
jgi:hypothetical protein